MEKGNTVTRTIKKHHISCNILLSNKYQTMVKLSFRTITFLLSISNQIQMQFSIAKTITLFFSSSQQCGMVRKSQFFFQQWLWAFLNVLISNDSTRVNQNTQQRWETEAAEWNVSETHNGSFPCSSQQRDMHLACDWKHYYFFRCSQSKTRLTPLPFSFKMLITMRKEGGIICSVLSD